MVIWRCEGCHRWHTFTPFSSGYFCTCGRPLPTDGLTYAQIQALLEEEERVWRKMAQYNDMEDSHWLS